MYKEKFKLKLIFMEAMFVKKFMKNKYIFYNFLIKLMEISEFIIYYNPLWHPLPTVISKS